MNVTRDKIWYHYPAAALPSPVLALATSHDGIWAGGAGGVAWYPINTDWQPRISGLPLTSVAALLSIETLLIAGGAGGIAYSHDAGMGWQRAEMSDGIASVLAFAVSPHFARDRTLVAATLENGILRSTDAGQSWHQVSSNQDNLGVSALVWRDDAHILAGTTQGIYRSINGGQDWHIAKDSTSHAIAALTYLPDGTILAAPESGGLLYSSNNGTTWSVLENAPKHIVGNAFFVTLEGTILWGTIGNGILRSTDNGHSWQQVHDNTVFSFASVANTLYAGFADGLSVSVDDGITWILLPYPPIYDLRRILIVDAQPLLVGAYAGLHRYNSIKHIWVPLPTPEIPLASIQQVSERNLVASSLAGLSYTSDGGETWRTAITGMHGQVAHFTFREDGVGYAGSANAQRMLLTRNGGIQWEQLETPFGPLPLIALQVTAKGLLAATYDLQRSRVSIWHSFDEGKSWQRGIEAKTTWPVIATCQKPALFTLGGLLFLQQPDGQWIQKKVGSEGIRRIVATGETLIVQTINHLYTSTDNAETWQIDESDLPVKQILDLTCAHNTLYVLLTAGRVWSRTIGPH